MLPFDVFARASRCQAAVKVRNGIHQKQGAAIQRELNLKDIVN